MIKNISKITAAALVASTISTVTVASDDFGFNASANYTSDYVWRGMTQNEENPALQAGVEASFYGFSIGVWGSEVANSGDEMEVDLYAGYSYSFGPLEAGVSYTAYRYPGEASWDFDEVALNVSGDIGIVSVGASYAKGLDDANDNMEVTAGMDIWVLALDLVAGSYDNMGTYQSATLSKSVLGLVDVAASYSQFSGEGNNADQDSVNVSVGLSF